MTGSLYPRLEGLKAQLEMKQENLKKALDRAEQQLGSTVGALVLLADPKSIVDIGDSDCE